MLVEHDYRGHRIEIEADLTDGRWDAVVRIRRTLTDEKPHVERVTCRKFTAGIAEMSAVIWATRHVRKFIITRPQQH